MISSIDHVVILVHDLGDAVRDYTALGFTVVPGGEHADNRSANALIAFSDGSYLELIAFTNNIVPETHHFYRPNNPEGLVTFALLPTDLYADMHNAHDLDLILDGPHRGGRLRPDGRRVEWQTAWPPTNDLPFLCADITPRALRVPGPELHNHKNGATGVSALGIVVSNIEESFESYCSLLALYLPQSGIEQFQEQKEVAFTLGDSTIVLAQPTTTGDLYEHLRTRGEGPNQLALSANPDIRPETLDPTLTHGVPLILVSAPLKVNSVGEEYAYIATLTCSKCGNHYRVVRQSLHAPPGRVPMDIIEIICLQCGQSGFLHFDISSFFGR